MEGESKDQGQEGPIVVAAYAVVQPDAVVVEVERAPVAPPTVLGRVVDMGVASVAVIVILLFWEGKSRFMNTLWALTPIPSCAALQQLLDRLDSP